MVVEMCCSVSVKKGLVLAIGFWKPHKNNMPSIRFIEKMMWIMER